MGFRLTFDKFNEYALELLDKAVAEKMVCGDLAEAIKTPTSPPRKASRRSGRAWLN